MTHKIKGRFLAPNQHIGEGKLISSLFPSPKSPIKLERFSLAAMRARFYLEDATLSMTAANDFGALIVADLPNTNMLIIGATIDAAFSVAGFATNTGAAMDFAIGTVTTASADFSNAGEDDLMAKVDGVGATAVGTVKGSMATGITAPVYKAAGASNDLFLNASSPVTSGTGVITFTGGYLDITYFDLGVVS